MDRISKHGTAACIAALAIALVMMVAGGICGLAEGEEDNAFELSDASHGVTVQVVENPEQQPAPMLKLLELSEEELFSRWPTAIVRGVVTDIKNIKLEAVADEFSMLRAIVTVTPSKVLRDVSDSEAEDETEGEAEGETEGGIEGDITILVNCPIDGSFILEDTETVSAIRLGMEGIFMVQPYADDELWELENSALRWKDLADYHFPDGRRYAFLSTEDGLLYAEWAYPGLAGAETLDDVEAYIGEFIK